METISSALALSRLARTAASSAAVSPASPALAPDTAGARGARRAAPSEERASVRGYTSCSVRSRSTGCRPKGPAGESARRGGSSARVHWGEWVAISRRVGRGAKLILQFDVWDRPTLCHRQPQNPGLITFFIATVNTVHQLRPPVRYQTRPYGYHMKTPPYVLSRTFVSPWPRTYQILGIYYRSQGIPSSWQLTAPPPRDARSSISAHKHAQHPLLLIQ